MHVVKILILLSLASVVFPSRVDAQTDEAASSVATLKKLSIDELMDIQVTSVSRQPEELLNAAAAIQVVTGEDISRSGASTIPEALRLADNLDVVQKNSSDWAISARGFNASVGNKLLVLMDGRSIYTPLFSGVIWNMQDYLLADIDRIEVISGPGGSLWGANAVNGVINIISKNAKDTQGLYLETGGGSGLEDFAAARYGGELAPNVYFRVYGKYLDEGSEAFADGSNAADPWHREQAGFRIDSLASPENQFTLQADAFGSNIHTTPGGENMAPAEGTSSGGNLLGRWTHVAKGSSVATLQIYYDRTHLAAPFQASGSIPPGILLDDLDTFDLDFQDHFPLDARSRIVWGFGYRFTHDVITDAPLVAFIPGTLNQSLFSGFIQDEIELQEKVSLIVGAKLEHNDYTGFEFEPNVRLRWDIGDSQMLWGAVSKAVRTPSRYDRDLSEPNPRYGVLLDGNSTFQSETVIAYELGYRAQLGQEFSGSLSLFYNEYDHVRSLGYTPVTLVPLFFQNNDEAQTQGLEFSADYQIFDWWRLHGGYDLLKEHVWVRPGRVDLFNALNETADPEHQFSVRSSIDLSRKVELDTALRWVDKLTFNDNNVPGTVPSYFELDARVGWQATKQLELSLVGQNLLHAYHVEFGAPEPAQEEIQRTVYAKATWRF